MSAERLQDLVVKLLVGRDLTDEERLQVADVLEAAALMVSAIEPELAATRRRVRASGGWALIRQLLLGLK